MALVTLGDIRSAQIRIAPAAVRTPLVQLSNGIFVKDESAQPIGSFKLRGAYNRIALLAEEDPDALRRGVITYSSGNHAQGVAYAARALGTKAVIVMPENAPTVKIEATRELGAEVVFVGSASSARKLKAEELAEAHGYTIVPPYDDPAVIAGQATCGVEILEQVAEAGEDPSDLLILSPVSGGGLLSGTATGVKLLSPTTQVWGAEPELAADATESFQSGTLVEWPAASTTRTIADGLRTQSLGLTNFEHILKYVDGIVTVSEDQIFQAMRFYLATTTLVPEPSGAVTLAAAMHRGDGLPKARNVVVILSGGNLDPALRESFESETAAGRV
ncbi:threonine ammonia-lyase [Granulicella sibirica]|uniref:Threonine dehydratase, catabolic n=1 Tax=Granulicella sibirica TaxID=2479048 RepID=A0A4Q0SYD6_9BACT|nr:threonine/serine dehydratase [Granulicella sibirica]RXH55000.1 Threonine dehydratase, catabolic [Granulicella sibirica]